MYFAFVDPGVHSRIINLNKLIHKWSGAVNSILLNKFKKFQFLEIWHLYRKTAADVQGSATLASEESQVASGCPTLHGEAGICASSTIRGSVYVKHLNASIDIYVLGVEKIDMSKGSVQ